MKKYIPLFLILFSVFCFGQEKDLWHPFFKKNSNTMGFKDKNGKIMIKPKFFSAITEVPFDNIYGVSEINDYYLLKNGKKVGIDSLYYFETEVAYEHEGKIKFRDEKTDKVGFFDKNGKVVIPAIYNDAEDFHNSLARVFKDGKRWCYDNNTENRENCEHYGWKESRTLVINTNNQELFEIPDDNFIHSIDYNNIYKKNKVNKNVDSDIYTSYKGNDGNVYSFYSSRRDFKKWFETKFLSDFKTNGKISDKYFDKSIELQRQEKSKYIIKKRFLDKHSQNINSLIKDYLQNEFEIAFSDENIFNEEIKELTIQLRLVPKIEKDYYQKIIIFKKVGDSFYIISAP